MVILTLSTLVSFRFLYSRHTDGFVSTVGSSCYLLLYWRLTPVARIVWRPTPVILIVGSTGLSALLFNASFGSLVGFI
jgi:hypothetical protein